MDGEARHCSLNKRNYSFTFPLAKQPLLMFDQSVNNFVSNRSTLGGYAPTANQGWTAQTFEYDPALWEAPADGMNVAQRHGRYRWTYGGLKGLDYTTTKEDAPIILTNAVDSLYRARPPF